MSRKGIVLSTGFAMFSMFFGSGNLVFPILVGKESGGHVMLAALGIFLTGVLVPFLGVFGMMLYKGSTENFFHPIGKIGTFVFSLFALSLMGPFGVLARCLAVAHGAFQMILPEASLVITSLVLCVVIYFLTVNKGRIVPVLGTFLTPILLLSIVAIALVGLFTASTQEVIPNVGFEALSRGFLSGYQTMDLLAAFFFSTFVIRHLKSSVDDTTDKSSLRTFFQSSCIGGGLLAIVYLLLVILGGRYGFILEGIAPQAMLGHIALHTLGRFGAPAVCISIVLACLTTAVVLASLFAEFLHKEVSREKIGSKVSLIITLAIGFAISTLSFSGIMAFLAPILEMIYPALIVFTLINIAHKFWGVTNSHWPATLTFVAKIYMNRV